MSKKRYVGGIPLQVSNDENDCLANEVDEAAEKTTHLLNHPEKAKQMKLYGWERIKGNFLIINDLKDYSKIFNEI